MRLVRLSSEPELFRPIHFHPGVNLILGEKADDTTVEGRKVNGVGKTLCVEFIQFCLLSEWNRSRLAKIPSGEGPHQVCPGQAVILDLVLGNRRLQIRRTFDAPRKVVIATDHSAPQTFDPIDEARDYLRELLVSHPAAKFAPSFREIMTVLIRDEGSQFSDILKTQAHSGIPPREPHLFLMGIDLLPHREAVEASEELSAAQSVANKLKEQLCGPDHTRIQDIRARLNQQKADVDKIEAALQELRAEPAFADAESQLVSLSTALETFRTQRRAIAKEIDRIRSLPEPEAIDEADIQILYDQFRTGLGSLIAKSLEQVREFKQKVERFQSGLLQTRLEELIGKHEELGEKIGTASRDYAALLTRVDQKGVLGELRGGLEAARNRSEDYYQTRALLNSYEQAEAQVALLRTRRTDAVERLRVHLETCAGFQDAFEETILQIHERIMGNREASFRFVLKPSPSAKEPLDFTMRIKDDGSYSVDRTRVFIYDMALLFNRQSRQHHPGFVLHDNLFNVDQDTLVQSLNFLAEQQEKGDDFQYLLTLNRDKIEHEERRAAIRLDVDQARVAKFTKEHPFLGFHYQERG